MSIQILFSNILRSFFAEEKFTWIQNFIKPKTHNMDGKQIVVKYCYDKS